VDRQTAQGVKAFKRIVTILAAIIVGLWIVVQFLGRNPPAGLGVHEGGLAECPDTPNCVCSDCERADKMLPLEYSADAATAKAALKSALRAKGIPIVEEQENYLHAVATTPLMRFKDDLEFLIVPEEKKIHFRSASRLGKSDLGKNRARLREVFAELEKSGVRVGTTEITRIRTN
jgi:uncharacterized protein (DUF1499 family)